MFVNNKNKFKVIFITDQPYWNLTVVAFSGINASRFYEIIKQKPILASKFSSATLGRVDLCYSREYKITDKISVEDFFSQVDSKIKQMNQTSSYQKNSKGVILKIGNRGSNHYFRIYTSSTKDYLRFEHEIKKESLKPCDSLLVANNFEEFENQLSKCFLQKFGQVLLSPCSDYCYLDWLVIKSRMIQKQKIVDASSGFKLDYICPNHFSTSLSRQQFYTLLEFLVYVENLKYERGCLGSTNYRLVTF